MWLWLVGLAAAGVAYLKLSGDKPLAAITSPVPPAADPVINPAQLPVPPPQTHDDLVTASASLASMADPANMVPVEYQGEMWLVSPQYIGPVGIGEAFDLAKSLGLSLPSPGLVDAIWRAADLHVMPPTRASDGTPKTMSSPAVYADQKNRIDALVGGRPFTLLAGTHKDVVLGDAMSFASSGGNGLKPGKPGLYGWHSEAASLPGIALHAPVTPGPGQVIQQPFGGHGLDWKDYSQGLRLVRKA